VVKNGLVKSDYTIAPFILMPGSVRSSLFQHALDADAIFFQTDGYFPFDDLSDTIVSANRAGIPVFLLGANSITENRPKRLLAEANDLGLTSLGAYSWQYWAVHQGIERILDTEDTLEARQSLSQTVFSDSQFFEKRPFLELMINPALKEYADGLPQDCGPIVIDCGHIDSPNFMPTDEDQTALEEGLVLFHYLRYLGHQDVKIAPLFNEMYADQKVDKKSARRFEKTLRKQAKKKGLHSGVLQAYREIFKGYGLTEDTWQASVVCSFEGSIVHQARQGIRAYEEGSNHPFKTELDDHGNYGFSYVATDGRERVIASPDKGAPLCSLVSSGVNKRHDAKGAQRVVYLYDQKWRPGVRCGAIGGRELYGTNLVIDAFFYGSANGRVGVVAHEKLS
jgi:hypothetical protein